MRDVDTPRQRRAARCRHFKPIAAAAEQHGPAKELIVHNTDTRKHVCAMRGVTDTETGMLPGIPGSAMCVQRFDDSLSSAIRITYRISLRSSSLYEPRYPPLKVVLRYSLRLSLRTKHTTTFQLKSIGSCV